MSGYDGYSMSNNAMDAYDDYKMPLSRLKSFLGITDVSCSACEWHHTSKYYNAVNFYDARDAVRSGDIWKRSRKKPNPLQLYHRICVMFAIIEEEGFEPSIANIARFEKISKEANDYLAAKKQKKEKRETEKEQKKQEYLASIAAEHHREKIKALRQRCITQKITREKILAAFGGEGAGDPCCIYSQIRTWFYKIGVEKDKALEFAVTN